MRVLKCDNASQNRQFADRQLVTGRSRRRHHGMVCTAILFALFATSRSERLLAADFSATRIAIVVGQDADQAEKQIAEIMQGRIQKRSQITSKIVPESEAAALKDIDLTIFLGRQNSNKALADLCVKAQNELPDAKNPGPEGFLVKTVKSPQGHALLAVGSDKRGTMYAAGEVLRRLTLLPKSIEWNQFEMRSAPGYRWRGFSANQGGTMIQATGARGWTTQELHDDLLDYALAGANTFYAGGALHDWLRVFDMQTLQGCRPNELPGDHAEWRRRGTENGPYVCPSIPEARKALMEHWDKEFKAAPNHALLRFYAGDPGGCRCDLCQPWGKTFVLLCEEVTAIWNKYHPGSEVQICNQDLSNAGDEAIFDYLNEKPRKWLTSMSYGPGSNAMSRYFRDELRDDLFIYPGHGPVNRYLAYTLQSIPKYQSIVHYSDITHWISAQYMCEKPDPYISMIYGRRTFHQRPQAFYSIFNRIMPFSEGDVIYSEGHHDELHQYLWNRMLWNPNRTLDDLMTEYATLHFGSAAAPEMIEASKQLEANLEAPLATNKGVERYYALVKRAGDKIPANVMQHDYRWREHLQKAALDRYFQLKLRRQTERNESVSSRLASALKTDDAASDPRPVVAEVRQLLNSSIEDDQMKSLREEAIRVAEESNRNYGVKNTGLANLEVDFVGLEWLKSKIEDISAISDLAALRSALKAFVNYEDPGEGGFYDDAGAPGKQPHLKVGNVRGNMGRRGAYDPKNRPSANTIAFNRQGPVVFAYEGLDPKASYRVKVTLVTPRFMPQNAAARPANLPARALRRTENILADDIELAHEIEIPAYTAGQFEFPIPASATADGKLEIKFVAGAVDVPFASASVSEIWLMKAPAK